MDRSTPGGDEKPIGDSSNTGAHDPPSHVPISLSGDSELMEALRRLGCELLPDGSRRYSSHQFERQIENLLGKYASGGIPKATLYFSLHALGKGARSTKHESGASAVTAEPGSAETPAAAVPVTHALERYKQAEETATSPPPVETRTPRKPCASEPEGDTALRAPTASGQSPEVTISPPAGCYDEPQKVMFRCADANALIRHIKDGSEPTAESPQVDGDLMVSEPLTIAARAFVAGREPGPVARATFSFRPAPVEFSPPPGIYNPPHAVTLQCPTLRAKIRYTLDATEPDETSTEYGQESILLEQSAKISARAFVPGWEPGPVTSAEYTVQMPQWKVLEPEDRADAVEHAVSEMHQTSNGWTLVGASVRGKLHAHRALWRDDAFAFGQEDPWTIIAVSDGAGSATLSRLGARIACDSALAALRNLLHGYVLTDTKKAQPKDADLMRVKTFLCEAARSSLGEIRREASRRGRPAEDFAATLLIAVHTTWQQKDLAAAIQIGDGAIGLLASDGSATLLGVPDHGEHSSETRFLTTRGIEQDISNRVLFSIKEDLVAVAVMTDGVSDDFFPEDKRLGELFLADAIPEMARADGSSVRGLMRDVVGQQMLDAALLRWIQYDKKGSSDDRTLVLLVRENEP